MAKAIASAECFSHSSLLWLIERSGVNSTTEVLVQVFLEELNIPLPESAIEFIEELDLRGAGVIGHLGDAAGGGPL